MRRRFATAAALIAATIAQVSRGPAADFAPNESTTIALPVPVGWTFRTTPYAWLTSLKGSQTIKGRTADVDITFIDLARKVLDNGGTLLAVMGNFEARNGPLAFFGDGIWELVQVSGTHTSVRDPSPRVSTTLSAALRLQFQMGIFEGGAAYELTQFALPIGSGTVPIALDALAGARVWYQRLDFGFDLARITDLNVLAVRGGRADLGGNPDLLELIAQGTAVDPRTLNLNDLRGDRVALARALLQNGLELKRNRALARSGSVSWMDPFIGARLRTIVAPGHELFLRGDVGGFGVGSRFSWQAIGGYSFDIAVKNGVTYSGLIGYKALYVDYSRGQGSDRYSFDMLQHGPVLGFSIRF